MHRPEYHYQRAKQVSPACSRRDRVVRQISRYRFLASFQIHDRGYIPRVLAEGCRLSAFLVAARSELPREKATATRTMTAKEAARTTAHLPIDRNFSAPAARRSTTFSTRARLSTCPFDRGNSLTFCPGSRAQNEDRLSFARLAG